MEVANATLDGRGLDTLPGLLAAVCSEGLCRTWGTQFAAVHALKANLRALFRLG